ncbi:hypothetical protein HYH02_000396 [Chlamydomonas schloesseri]|uniref:Tubulin/FtsZ GTPase domain-containing protein n=1 Tax=Chlamydomonas schloesseri TaxID=2026947 RepID=A0A836BCL9_9CHLO|nr:hypothetical protein HYH02_000396 [Chlamydomonas schloesseri]|eukprot:KAG2454551.1 hypothetical protein HYH02_000396 [Chlamydomonas schloesseri]
MRRAGATGISRRCPGHSQRLVRVAYRQGDETPTPAAPTARAAGTVTVNPVPQISIVVPIQSTVVAAAPATAAASPVTAVTADEVEAPPAKPAVEASSAPAASLAAAKPAELVPAPASARQASSGATQAAPPPQQPVRAQLKVIGMGVRGISAVNRLMAAGTLPEAEFWALDSDKRVLSGADVAAHTLEVGPGDEATLSPEDLAALACGPQAAAGASGQPAGSAAAASSGPDGHAGAVFVLGSAFGSPGGAPMMLQLVRHLRRQGYFVAATLTRPFEFEGVRKLEAADALISTMEEVAHLVVVIAQGVLTRASAELTMGQAQAIADNTLVYTVQSTLWALRAPEILKVSHGAFLWHGRDLRNIKRPLFPPMMSLLSCPGHATLGRGQAALPLPLLQQAGLASALSTLAEDAVKAAAESPFLDNKLESATGVLCVLRVPPSALGVGVRPATATAAASGPANSSTNTPLVADNHKEYALRSAVQVAAMTVRELVGRHCHDIIVCPQLCQDLESPPPRAQQQQAVAAQAAAAAGSAVVGAEGGEQAQQQVIQTQVESPDGTELVRVEVSLLVLESIEEMAEAKAVAGQKPDPAAAAAAAAAASAAAAAAADAPPTPTAATARDRIGSVISQRAPSAPRRPGPRPLSARGSGPSIFTGSIPGQPAPEPAPTAAQPAWAPSSAAGTPPPAAPVAPAAAASATPPPQASGARPGAAGAPSPAAPAAATAAASAAAAAANAAARKQARLASMSAMSALAGGSASAVHNNILGASALGAAPAAAPAPNAAAGAAGAAGFSPTGVPLNARGLPMYPQPQQQQQPAQPLAAAAEPEPAPPAPAPAANPFEGGLQQIPRLAESLVTSLVAQSLDLPPQAARWRHQQRVPAGTPRPTSPAFHLPRVDEDVGEDGRWMEGQAESEQGLGRGLQQLIMGMRLPGMGGDGTPGGAAPGPAVRNRVAGMLDRERQD